MKKRNTTESTKVRCAIYTRKSTIKGLEQNYNSLEAQEDRCRDFIGLHEAQGWEFYKIYSDAGISGGTTERPGLQAMLTAAKAKKFDMVIVIKLDRLARNQRDFLNLLDMLSKNGVEVASVTEQFDSSSYMGRAMRNLLGVFAEMEREMIAERTREKMEASRRKGLYIAGKPPIGYVRGENKLLQIAPEGAAVVQRIYRDYHANGTTHSIAARLNKEGIMRPTRSGKMGPWSHIDVGYILRNALYAGYIASGEDLYEGQHEAIVPRDLWKQVQDKLNIAAEKVKAKVSRKRPRMFHSLADLLHCGNCGSPMTGTYGIHDKKVYRYYTCTKRRKYGKSRCACPYLNAEQIENFVRDQVMALRDNQQFLSVVLSRMPGVPGGRISDCIFNMEKLLQYGTPMELAEIFKRVFSTIVFDWEKQKVDFQYQNIS